jgi:hypothetical protein
VEEQVPTLAGFAVYNKLKMNVSPAFEEEDWFTSQMS